jgi:hypothetical protein
MQQGHKPSPLTQQRQRTGTRGKLRAKASTGDGKMAIRKDPRDEATGAEKSPSRVGRFVLITLAGAVIALLGVLLYLYNHPLGLR